jgi:hypothetical protein
MVLVLMPKRGWLLGGRSPEVGRAGEADFGIGSRLALVRRVTCVSFIGASELRASTFQIPDGLRQLLLVAGMLGMNARNRGHCAPTIMCGGLGDAAKIVCHSSFPALPIPEPQMIELLWASALWSVKHGLQVSLRSSGQSPGLGCRIICPRIL